MKTFPTFTPAPQPQEKPKDELDAARAAFRDHRYPEALSSYEWFFDHALDDDPAALYGVRLSYCLREWARLGAKYPPALQRLQERRDQALAAFGSTRDPERFHDFKAICEALDEESKVPASTFADVHQRDRTLAALAVRFIWHEIVDAEMWDVAGTYITDYQADYESAVERFAETMVISEENPDLGGEEFSDQIRGWCIRDLRDLWLVLKHSNRTSEAEAIKQLAQGDARLRNHPAIAEKAFAGDA